MSYFFNEFQAMYDKIILLGPEHAKNNPTCTNTHKDKRRQEFTRFDKMPTFPGLERERSIYNLQENTRGLQCSIKNSLNFDLNPNN